jgi:hypothetical protein
MKLFIENNIGIVFILFFSLLCAKSGHTKKLLFLSPSFFPSLL